MSTAMVICYENLENREKLHVPFGPLYLPISILRRQGMGKKILERFYTSIEM